MDTRKRLFVNIRRKEVPIIKKEKPATLARRKRVSNA